MRRRRGWIAGGIVAAVVLIGLLVWLLPQIGRTAPAATSSPSTSPTPTASIAERAQDALDRRLTECAASTGATPPPHCGIRIPWGTDFSSVSGIRYRVEKLPVLALDGGSFTAAGGRLVATVTGTGQDGAARTETYSTDDWAVRGDLVTDGDAIDVDVW